MPQPREKLDMLSYGEPAALPFDPAEADRTFRYSMGRRPGFVDGKPGFWWSINGHLWPDVPMYLVDEGDVVVMEIENHSGEVHPMHLHGHHAVVHLPRRRAGHAAARGGSTRSTSRTARRSRSPSSPTTPASGWTTATTSSTPRRGWSPT